MSSALHTWETLYYLEVESDEIIQLCFPCDIRAVIQKYVMGLSGVHIAERLSDRRRVEDVKQIKSRFVKP